MPAPARPRRSSVFTRLLQHRAARPERMPLPWMMRTQRRPRRSAAAGTARSCALRRRRHCRPCRSISASTRIVAAPQPPQHVSAHARRGGTAVHRRGWTSRCTAAALPRLSRQHRARSARAKRARGGGRGGGAGTRRLAFERPGTPRIAARNRSRRHPRVCRHCSRSSGRRHSVYWRACENSGQQRRRLPRRGHRAAARGARSRWPRSRSWRPTATAAAPAIR